MVAYRSVRGELFLDLGHTAVLRMLRHHRQHTLQVNAAQIREQLPKQPAKHLKKNLINHV